MCIGADSNTAPPLLSTLRMNKPVWEVVPLEQADDDRALWLGRSPAQRLEAVELMRRINYGEAAATARLQRVFEYAELPIR